eukprot:6181784-Pleurochrysis_carterae.AAC.2
MHAIKIREHEYKKKSECGERSNQKQTSRTAVNEGRNDTCNMYTFRAIDNNHARTAPGLWRRPAASLVLAPVARTRAEAVSSAAYARLTQLAAIPA